MTGNAWVHVANAALGLNMLKHQAISNHSADKIFIVLGKFLENITNQYQYQNITFIVETIRKWNYIFKTYTQGLRVKM